MGTVSILHANGGEPETGVQCAYCHAWLGDERAVSNTPIGVRFFCRADPEYPQESCFLQWKRSHH